MQKHKKLISQRSPEKKRREGGGIILNYTLPYLKLYCRTIITKQHNTDSKADTNNNGIKQMNHK